MTSPLRLLCVGLTPADLARLREEFAATAPAPHLETVDCLEGLRPRLGEPDWSAAVVEYSSHRGGGPEALRLRNELAPRLPFIFVADSLDAEAVIAAMKAGATDLALLSHHRPLRAVLEQAVREAAALPRHDEAAELAALSFRHLPDQAALFGVEPGGRYLVQGVNPAFVAAAAARGAGLAERDWKGKTLRELVSLAFPFSRNLHEVAQQRFVDAAMRGQPVTAEAVIDLEDGRLHQEQVVVPIFDAAHRCKRLLWTLRDITGRKQAEVESRANEARLREANFALLALARSRNFHGDNLIDALREITQVSGQALAVARSSIWLYNHVRSKIRCIDLYDLKSGAHSEGQELYYADHPSYFLSMEAQRVIAASDALHDVRTREYARSYLLPLGITAMLDAAVRLRGELVGVICLEHVGPRRDWTTEEEVFAAALADVVSLALEASERQRVETELRESQQKLRLHVQHTPLGVVEWNHRFEVTAWNPAAEAIFGFPAYEAVGKPGMQFVAEESKAQVAQVWKELLQARGGQRSSNRNVRKDGTVIDCEWYNTPLIDEEGRIVGVASLALDVTDRLKAERSLRASEERFGRAFRSSPLVMAIARLRDRRFVAVNETCLRLAGLAREEALGKTIAEMGIVTPPGFADRQYDLLERGLVQPPQEITVRTPSGAERVGLAAAERIDSDGEPCVLWTFQDLTALRAAERELAELKQARELAAV